MKGGGTHVVLPRRKGNDDAPDFARRSRMSTLVVLSRWDLETELLVSHSSWTLRAHHMAPSSRMGAPERASVRFTSGTS